MNLVDDWSKIKIHFRQSFSTNLHVSIASVNTENMPTVTPIGTVFLNDNQTGFYFEKYAKKLSDNKKRNPNVCLLAVNSCKLFWFKSLFKTRFDRYPAVKLYGTLGEKREATEQEVSRLKRRMSKTKYLRGHKYLWGKMQLVRDIKFTNAEIINLAKMTKDL